MKRQLTTLCLLATLPFGLSFAACGKKEPAAPTAETTAAETPQAPQTPPSDAPEEADQAEPTEPIEDAPSEPEEPKGEDADDQSAKTTGSEPDEDEDEPSTHVASILASLTAFNDKGIDAYVDTYFHPDAEMIVHGDPASPFVGAAAIKATLAPLKKGIPDATLNATRVFDLGDTVVLEGVLNGTHTGAFHSFAATNKTVGLPELHFFTFRGDKIAKVVTYMDGMTLLKQLGQLPVGVPGADVVPIPQDPPTIIDSPPQPKALASWEAMMKAGDAKTMAVLFEDDSELWDAATGETIKGQAGFAAWMKMFETAFPDAKPTIDQKTVVGNFVIARLLWKGTHTGELAGKPGTGKKFVSHAAEIVVMSEDGKLLRSWVYSNHMELATQLGLLDPPKDAPKP